jgi:hypothetical protein
MTTEEAPAAAATPAPPAPLTEREKDDLRALDRSMGTHILDDDADDVLDQKKLGDEAKVTFSCEHCGADLEAVLEKKELELIVTGSGDKGAAEAKVSLEAMNDPAQCRWYPEPPTGFRLWLKHECPVDGRKNPSGLPILKRTEAKRMIRLIDARRREVDRRAMLKNPRLVFALTPARD